MNEEVEFEELRGKTFTDIEVGKDNDIIIFTCSDGSQYEMYHKQDCCERVTIEDIDGDIKDLIGDKIMWATKSTNKGDSNWGTFTWTFYTLATTQVWIKIRWYGASNGYYSEKVNLFRVI